MIDGACRARGWLLIAGAVALLGCGHARGVENPATTDEGKPRAGKVPNDTPPSDRPHPAPSARAEPPHDEKPGGSTTAVPLSTAPAGQLAEGAARKIQDRLVALGLLDGDDASGEIDDLTSGALRRFQKSHDLAATGAPDQATVRALSLDPKQVFRAAP